MTALDDLMALVPAPADPVGAPFDWRRVEANVGLALPEDYKRFCDRYGHGAFVAGWNVDAATPGATLGFDMPTSGLNFLLEDSEWSPHPAPGGLLLFASTETKETFWWRTDTWAVVFHSDLVEFVETKMTATEAILATVRGEPPVDWNSIDEFEDEDPDDPDPQPMDRTPRFYPEGPDDEADEEAV